MSDFGKDLAASVPLFAFPFVWLAGRDYTSDYRQFSTNFLVINKGDVDTGMKVTFIAKGVVKNPKLYLQNGQYLRVLGDLVTFVDHEVGIVAEQRVTEIYEYIEEGERRIDAVFGQSKLNVMEKIKKGVV